MGARDINRFPTVQMVKTRFLLEDLGILEPCLGIMKSSNIAQLSLKFNWGVLYLSKMYCLCMYAFRYISYTKTEFIKLPTGCRSGYGGKRPWQCVKINKKGWSRNAVVQISCLLKLFWFTVCLISQTQRNSVSSRKVFMQSLVSAANEKLRRRWEISKTYIEYQRIVKW